jgi:hypothetical protein
VDAHEKNCESCQGVLRAASALRFKRLGRHERRQLLDAAEPGGPPHPIRPPGPSQAEQTATRRAVANLVAHGLIRLAPEEVLSELGRRRYAVLRQAWRSDLGEEIVRRYRAELEAGERIRWIYHLEPATAAALGRCPDRAKTVRDEDGLTPRRLARLSERDQKPTG